MRSGNPVFLDLPHSLQLAGRVIGGQDLIQAVGRVPGERVADALEQPVRPGRADPAAEAAPDLLGLVLPRVGHGLVRETDQMEVINGEGGSWKPCFQRLPDAADGSIATICTPKSNSIGWGEETTVPNAVGVPATDDS